MALRPGKFTVARPSQTLGALRLVVSAGEMLARPASFDGTSGVIRLETPTSQVIETLPGKGL